MRAFLNSLRRFSLTGLVVLRPKSRVAGFGRGTVYVSRLDEDDLVYLERYRR